MAKELGVNPDTYTVTIPLGATINMAGTMRGRMHLALHSPTLRFMMFGGFMYMLSSLQGSFEALRAVNQVTHFTHFTVAHAHLGAYGFVTMVLFGAIYFMMPRLLQREWPFPRLISLQFWLAAVTASRRLQRSSSPPSPMPAVTFIVAAPAAAGANSAIAIAAHAAARVFGGVPAKSIPLGRVSLVPSPPILRPRRPGG